MDGEEYLVEGRRPLAGKWSRKADKLSKVYKAMKVAVPLRGSGQGKNSFGTCSLYNPGKVAVPLRGSGQGKVFSKIRLTLFLEGRRPLAGKWSRKDEDGNLRFSRVVAVPLRGSGQGKLLCREKLPRSYLRVVAVPLRGSGQGKGFSELHF